MTFSHQSVLLKECIHALAIQPEGIYIDATFGRGGHARAILAQLNQNGRLYAIDQDRAAIDAAADLSADPRFCIRQANFADLRQLAKDWQIEGKVAGILLDLGVSSPQLDDAARGFSFMHDGDLDMRMNQDHGQSVARWLENVSQADLADVIYQYGEERNARRIARAIIARRADAPITRTLDLAGIVAAVNHSPNQHKHPATRTFQALRIFINRELEVLPIALKAALDVLAIKGRMAVMAFHSLEDRIVKNFMRQQSIGTPAPRYLPQINAPILPLGVIGKAIKADESELQQNPRARSAVLRVAEKIREVAA